MIGDTRDPRVGADRATYKPKRTDDGNRHPRKRHTKAELEEHAALMRSRSTSRNMARPKRPSITEAST